MELRRKGLNIYLSLAKLDKQHIIQLIGFNQVISLWISDGGKTQSYR